MRLARALQAWFGNTGVYLLAAVSGLSDVDAVTLSMSQMSGHELPVSIAARAITLAAIVNTLVKGLLAVGIAGGVMGRLVGVALAIAVLAGIAILAVAWAPVLSAPL